jgi:hypothetical protein
MTSDRHLLRRGQGVQLNAAKEQDRLTVGRGEKDVSGQAIAAAGGPE